MEILKFLAKVLDAQIWITAITILLGVCNGGLGSGYTGTLGEAD